MSEVPLRGFHMLLQNILACRALGRFPDCVSPAGDKYKVHPCTATPVAGKAITVSCEEEQVNVGRRSTASDRLGL